MNCLVTAAEVATKREAVGQIAEIYIQEDALFCDSRRTDEIVTEATNVGAFAWSARK